MPLDYHIHTYRCGHAQGAPGAYLARAQQLDFREIGIADHMPAYHLHPGDPRSRKYAMAMDDLTAYVDEVLRLREQAEGIRVRLGIEADFVPGREAELKDLLSRFPFDYVIGSVHFIGDWCFDDPDYIQKYDDWDMHELYATYFDLVSRAARSGLFDIVGHLDVVKKFGFRPAEDISPILEGVAAALGEAGVCVEVNTAGLRKPVNEMYPGEDLLRLCRNHGVEVTLGSDAHSPTEVGADFDKALAMLRSAGFDRITAFEGREPRFISLEGFEESWFGKTSVR